MLVGFKVFDSLRSESKLRAGDMGVRTRKLGEILVRGVGVLTRLKRYLYGAKGISRISIRRLSLRDRCWDYADSGSRDTVLYV